MSDRRRAGFTLVEILICVLLMGLSVGGLLDLLTWGTKRFDLLAREPQRRAGIADLRRCLRSLAAQGQIATGTLSPSHWPGLRLPAGSLRIAQLAGRVQDDLVFVRADLFDDVNGDGRAQAGERIRTPMWCFRTRSGR